MEKVLECTLLYDFYSETLTDKQKDFFELYYLNDLSLSEIAETEGITAQAVSNLLQRTESKLRNMESKLGLIEKHLKRKEYIKQAVEQSEKLRSYVSNYEFANEDINVLIGILEKLSLTD